MFDIDRIEESIKSGYITIPRGLTRFERREFVRGELEKLDTVLGYYPDGTEIKPIPTGWIATCACIFCTECRIMIRSMGGPGSGALCVRCWEVK